MDRNIYYCTCGHTNQYHTDGICVIDVCDCTKLGNRAGLKAIDLMFYGLPLLVIIIICFALLVGK